MPVPSLPAGKRLGSRLGARTDFCRFRAVYDGPASDTWRGWPVRGGRLRRRRVRGGEGCTAAADAALGLASQVSVLGDARRGLLTCVQVPLLDLLGLVTKVRIASMWAMCFWVAIVSGVKVSRAWIDRKCMPPKEGDK